jgi:uncharacterized membrane protein
MGLSSLSWLVLAGSVCNSIGVCCIILAIVTVIIGGIFMINYFCSDYSTDQDNILRRGGIISWVFTIVFAIVAAFMPSEKAVYMVAGIELVNQFSHTETAKELGDSGMSIVKDITQIIHSYTIDDNYDRDRRR